MRNLLMSVQMSTCAVMCCPIPCRLCLHPQHEDAQCCGDKGTHGSQ
jgi:hypothetical protein